MKLFKSYLLAIALGLAVALSTLSPSNAWAGRTETLGYLRSASVSQAYADYYATLGVRYNYQTYRYYEYAQAYYAYIYLYYAYVYAPSGSYMQQYAKLAMSYQYNAYVYSYYAYVYNSNYYETYAASNARDAEVNTAVAKYFAAFNG